MTDLRLPAYPIFVKDPFFSIWSDCNAINEKNTVFWHGEEKPIYGIIEIDGKEYSFLGTKDNAERLRQTSSEIKAFSTIYRFENELFEFDAEFLSPLLPNDILTAACPVCYLRYTLKKKKQIGCATVKLYVEERVCYNTCDNPEKSMPVRTGVLKTEKYKTAYMGLRCQKPLSHALDEVGADWGNYYVAGEYADTVTLCGREFIYACNVHSDEKESVKGTLYLAFDDSVSVFYFGEYLNGYFFKDGQTIFDAIDYSIENEKEIVDKCEKFDRELIEEAKPYGDKYLAVLYASLRQSMGAHKIVRDKKGRVLFLSKECNSDGCIATVDISYPSFPLYYKYNKELLKGMLYPIFDFAKMDVWEEKFAPHDVGVYPYCCGQYYAIKNEENKDYSYKLDGKPETLPMYYEFPKGNDIFNMERQMPVEESANMIILTYLTKDKEFMKENYPTLKTWSEYLIEKGLKPDNQICTDDFAGHLDKNANLAIKAIMGIKAFAYIEKTLGNDGEYKKYLDLSKDYANQWTKLYAGKEVSVLNLGNDGSYSIKYNLAIDNLIGERIFDESMKERETDYYLTKATRYGMPLDSRKGYTKADWIIWTAYLTKDVGKRKKYVEYIYNFLAETPDRVPFSDWYETENAKYCMFRNRTVVGGLFMLLIK